jgi:SAM-dependent MidA family methyltransferase
MSALAELLRQEIRQAGPIPFVRFMERALYCPELGYYDRFVSTVGRAGDYFTSVSVGPLFGELLARQFTTWLALLHGGAVQLIEAGAHDGQLAHDLLSWLRGHRPELWRRLEYWILEPSPRRQKWQREKLAPFAPRIRWLESWAGVAEREVHGLIFSNELLDAMAVHRLGWDAAGRQWFEWGVGLSGDEFVWQRTPEAAGPFSGALVPGRLPAQLLGILPDGFTIEICPQATAWWTQAASRLGNGYLLTFDYGLRHEEFLTPERSSGTLRAYRSHRLSSDVLADPGEQDLTAHVDFTAIQVAGEAAGLKTEDFLPQGTFLTRVVQTDPSCVTSPAQIRQFQTLTHPDHLGTRFKVLIQSRAPHSDRP